MTTELEMKIAEQLVDDALAAGYTVSVEDGEEITVMDSADRAEILGALQTTDMDRLYLHTPTGRHWILLIWGNDCDLISDYAGPDEVMAPLMESAQNVVDKYSA